ncbi:MAG: histidine phosphatase family protein [Thauera sp.]
MSLSLGRALIAALALAFAAPAAWAEDAARLFDRLGAGGYVIYWRHAATDRSQRDRDLSDMARCETQRNLSALGREQARRVGEVFLARGVPVGRVLASDFCRNRDTAQLAFGRHERVRELWNLPMLGAAGLEAEAAVLALRRLLGEAPQAGVNTVIVGHNLNLQYAAEVVIDEGEMAVFSPLGDSRFRLEGILRPADFAPGAP